MRSVGTTPARAFGAALLLTILTTPLFIDTRHVVRGADTAPSKAFPAELAKAIRDGDLKAVRALLDGGVDVNARDADDNTPLLLAAVYAGPDTGRQSATGRNSGKALARDHSSTDGGAAPEDRLG
jgi:hypothetical protein